MNKVNIPSPCHEDWNKMTPTAKGAFCSSCKIDVIDFTKKSNSEIQEILIENRGKKLCGHIKSTQLIALNQHYTDWENQSYKIFQSKFLLACVLVFGLFLFTGCEGYIKPDLVGEMVSIESDTAKTVCPTLDPKVNSKVDKKPININCNPPIHEPIDNIIDEPDYSVIDGDMMIDETYYDSLDIFE